MDLLGQVTIVVFAPTDLELVTGSPTQRRRFLDMTLCQVHPVYTRTLSQYQKVVAQRAALLRRIKDGEESPHALGYWDDHWRSWRRRSCASATPSCGGRR